MIKKKQRTVNVPTNDIVPYPIGPKKTPKFYARQLDEHSPQVELNNGRKRKAYKTDLAYILTKIICSVEGSLLPGWTGINIMLNRNEITDVSWVTYLTVINASPTECSTINTILQRSKDTADKLDLQYAVLVLDESVCQSPACSMERTHFLQQICHGSWQIPCHYVLSCCYFKDLSVCKLI